MLSRRERLMATLRGEPVDRPAVNFYEVGGFKVDLDDPDPFNVYNAPDWRPLVELAEQHTDIIRLMSPVRARSVDPTGSSTDPLYRELFRAELLAEEVPLGDYHYFTIHDPKERLICAAAFRERALMSARPGWGRQPDTTGSRRPKSSLRCCVQPRLC